MIIILAANAYFSQIAAGVRNPGLASVVDTVRTGSLAIICIAGSLLLNALWCGRPIIQDIPRLTMSTIWLHVYGLGILVFASVYCLLGISTSCTAAFVFALAGVGIDDLLVRSNETFRKRAAHLACTLFAVLTFLFIALYSKDSVVYSQAIDKGEWFVIFFAGILPLSSPFLFCFARGPKHYNPLTVFEFINYAMPFAFMLAVVVLCSLSVIPPVQTPLPLINTDSNSLTRRPLHHKHNYSTGENYSFVVHVQETLDDVTAADVALPFLPITMLPTLFAVVQTALLYTCVDFLSAFSIVYAAKHFAYNVEEGHAPYVLIFAGFAFCLRLYTCFIEKDDAENQVYKEQYDTEGEPLDPDRAEV